MAGHSTTPRQPALEKPAKNPNFEPACARHSQPKIVRFSAKNLEIMSSEKIGCG
jgi:hypothetical protein